MSQISSYDLFQTLKVTEVAEYVLNVELNRPEARNAINKQMFDEIKRCFEQLDADLHYRCVVLTGAGKMFSSGIDLNTLQESFMDAQQTTDIARRSLKLQSFIRSIQEPQHAIYKCRKPVIAAMHSAVIGGAIDMTSAVDIRFCSQDAWFQIKEVDLAIVPDIGTLQFLPPAVGNQSLLNELLYTGRKFDANEAHQLGYVSRVFQNFEATKSAAIELASTIAKKSPVAVQGIKHCLQYSKEHTIDDSLKYQSTWNMSQAQTEDTMKAAMAIMSKDKPPTFSRL